MNFINIKLKTNSYPIVFSSDFSGILYCLEKYLTSNKKIFFISDSNVSKIYLKKIINILKKENFSIEKFVFKAGEQSKDIKTLVDIYNYALKIGIDRKTIVIALGGGVVGDVAGFFASTFMRGLNFVQVPTTLLAMVDSSIGGKTGVNLENGKNIVGTFYQPKFVYINSNFLKTLETNHIKNGMGEVIKYAIAFSSKFFNSLNTLLLEKSIFTIDDFEDIIYKCCKFKAKIVEEDEKEQKGVRELLNLGHTFGHALETVTKYKKYLHGEAIILGILFVAKLANKIKFCDNYTKNSIEQIILNLGFNTKVNLKTNVKDILAIMKKDKKSISNTIRFVLPKKIGKAVSHIEVDDKIIVEAIKDFIK